jgi:hypothetical protein
MRNVDGHHHETHLKYVMWHRETIWKQMVSQDILYSDDFTLDLT